MRPLLIAMAWALPAGEYAPPTATLTLQASHVHLKAASGRTLYVSAGVSQLISLSDGRELSAAVSPKSFKRPVVLPHALGTDQPWVVSDEGDVNIRCREIVSGTWVDSDACAFEGVTDVNGDGLSDTVDHMRNLETVFDGDVATGSVGSVAQYVSTGPGEHQRFETFLEGSFGYPLPDLDGDGFGELMTADYPWVSTSVLWEGGYKPVDISTTRIFSGSAEGYLDVPWAELTHERVLFRPLPIQFDDDPELELLAFAARRSNDSLEEPVMLVLDVGADPPTLMELANPLNPDSPTFRYQDVIAADGYAHLVGDQDGDGIDDIVFVHGLPRLLGSTKGYDGSEPLFDFQYRGPDGDDSRGRNSYLVHDLDRDGYLDFIATWSGSVPSEADVVVVFGPFLEAPAPLETTDTGDTGDTAVSGTTPPSDTGDSGATTTSGSACGCRSGSTALTLLSVTQLPFARRR